jgi:large subunit ribosomal protein L17
MRHGKHQHTLVPTQEHRRALLSNLAAALFTHGRIQTTLAKAKALRPFAEKVITLAKKAKSAEKTRAVALLKLALTYVRDEDAVHTLFTKRVGEFLNRKGGYTRIYKLGRRVSDAGETALIELIPASDEGRKSRSKRTAVAAKPEVKAEAPAEAKSETKAEKKSKK